MTILTTTRLRLEPFQDVHIPGLHALNSDERVTHYITGRPETWAETEGVVQRVKQRWQQWGFSWWAFMEHASGELVGAGCIQYLGRDPANPHEIGWRLRPDKWGQGYASEAANVMAGFAFGKVNAPLLCAVCHPGNVKSARVMQRLGMHFKGVETWYDHDTHVYEMTRAQWAARQLQMRPTPA